MIGRAPRHSGLWFNFGHHHVGLSMAAGSAQLLADMMIGAPPLVDPRSFDPARIIPA
jgi:D-amino-acid dehydrogenase